MPTIVHAARILTPDDDFSPGSVLVEDGVITAVGADVPSPADAEVVQLPGATLVPGFIDLHVHGGGGFSLMTRDPEEIRSYARWVASRGVTSFLATICAEEVFGEGVGFVRTVASIVGTIPGGANLLGVNLEGPFLSPARLGALPKWWVMASSWKPLHTLLETAGAHLKIMTIAPEMTGNDVMMEEVIAHGAVASIGHTDADFETSLRAFKAGASHVTHALNAMRPFHHREPGPIGAALQSEGVTIEVIADGVHLHPATVALLVRSFDSDRVTLVTDGVTPAGLDEGTFRIGDQEAKLDGGRMLLPDGTIAGSAATMDQLVRNVVSWQIVDLADAVRMASIVPARVVGLSQRKGRIAPGCDADLVGLDGNLTVHRTWVGGVNVYSNTSG